MTPYDDPQAERAREETVAALADLAGLVHVLDVGAHPLDQTPPYAPLLDRGLARVTGFEPQREGLNRLEARATSAERYLPYALGDGGPATLHVCSEEGFTSLLRPDRRRLELLVDFPNLASVTQEVPVDTTALDDVPDLGRVDLLKMDVQGSELVVLQHGRRALKGLLAAQVEVALIPLYVDQPSAAELDAEIRSLGLTPLAVVEANTWPLAPTQWADPWQARSRHLVDCDVLYVRDLVELPDGDARDVAALALIGAIAYRHEGLLLRCVQVLVDAGALPSDALRGWGR